MKGIKELSMIRCLFIKTSSRFSSKLNNNNNNTTIKNNLNSNNIMNNNINQRGFLRTGVGQSMDSIDEYVEKNILQEETIDNLQQLTGQYFQSIINNDQSKIQLIAKNALANKTIQWLNLINHNNNSNGYQLSSAAGQNHLTYSLQALTNYSHLYGLENRLQENNPTFNEFKSHDLNKTFLVKRILFLQGFKLHKLLLQKSILLEAIIYTNVQLSITPKNNSTNNNNNNNNNKNNNKSNKNNNNNYNNNSNEYSGYKISFVCDSQLEKIKPYSIANEEEKRMITQNEQKQLLYKLNSWRIVDINDWVYSELSNTHFNSFAFNAAIDTNIQTNSDHNNNNNNNNNNQKSNSSSNL